MKSNYLSNTILLVVIFLLTFPTDSHSEDKKIEVLGTPSVKVESFLDETTRHELTEKQMRKYQLTISEVGGKFYWESRGQREMLKNVSGVYIIYVSPKGSGYVKVSTLNNFYIEHIHQGLNTITYWGIVQEGKLKISGNLKFKMSELADEFSVCSAYYTLLSEGTKNNPEFKKQTTDLGEYAFLFSSKLSSNDVALARVELDMKIMMREMNNSMLDASIIINKYGEKCALLLKEPEKKLLELKNN